MAKKTKQSAIVSSNTLRELGIVGYDSVESIFIAALTTELPLLIIGPHGTAKSLLLNWLAEALNLKHRHYNAAMINFDDLVGFPFPNDSRTSLEYIPTKGSIWGAESVFIDEISRTRVDMQNRLFPIIHEKVIQGIPLPTLKYRWAAMNPPKIEELENDDLWQYEGSEPLDIALADRFPFVVNLPSFADFSVEDKLAVISGQPEKEAPLAGMSLNNKITSTKIAMTKLKEEIGSNIAAYIHAIHPLLEKMKRPISPRRARAIHDVVLAVIAAETVRGNHDPKPAAFLALSNALPHPAYGQPINPTELLAAHNQAWNLAAIPVTDPRRIIFAESDPVKRVALGLQLNIPDIDLSTLVLSAYSGLDEIDKICFATCLYPVVSTTRNLTAVAFETLANEWSAIENESSRSYEVESGSQKHQQWKSIADWISDQGSTPQDSILINIVLVLFERGVKFKTQDIKTSFARFSELFPWKEEK